jgi:3-phosphoshikimate 1-carboxyvinyltransferase
VRGDVSSQFISALMMIGPLLDGGLCIRVDGPLVSRPYVEMTASVMRSFGAAVVVGDSRIDVRQKPYTPADYLVEPDFSSAAFAIMALAFRKGRVLIPGLALATMQGDSAVLGVAEAMGMKVQRVGNDIVVERDADRVLAVDVNLADASDLVPAVAVACCAAAGTSTITGVGFIRAKESDRLGDFAAEMSRFGCTVEVLADGLRIHGGEIGSSDSPMGVHHDHRLAMAFALLAGSGRDVLLEDAEVVSKSWPSYFGDMGALLGPVTALN